MDKTLYYNGRIITMEGGYAEAVVSRGERIEFVGPLSEARSRGAARPVDLRGACMLPAFIDAHSHLTAFARTLTLADLGGAKSFDEIVTRLQAYKRQNGLSDEAWIVGFGYDHNTLFEGAHPHRRLLDSLQNPVLITHASGHMGVMNTRALALAGVDENASDPPGGRVGRDGEGLTGYLEEAAFMRYNRAAAVDGSRIETAVARAQEIYASYGIATVQEGLVDGDSWRLLIDLAGRGKLTLDVVGYADIMAGGDLFRREIKGFGTYRRNLRLGGYKLFLDGSPQGRTAWLTEPYEGETDYRGYPVYDDETVAGCVRRCREENAQLLTHCNGDAAAEQLLNALGQEGGKNGRPVMIHAQLLRPDQLPRVAALGVIPSFFVAHTYHWGDVHLKNLGDRARRISPLRSAAALGIPYTLHQDTPVLPPDMMFTLWAAACRLTREGVPLGKEERADVIDALKAVTISAAFQYFEESVKGSIKAGKYADFAILSDDPLTTPPERLREIEVLETVRRGETIYRK